MVVEGGVAGQAAEGAVAGADVGDQGAELVGGERRGVRACCWEARSVAEEAATMARSESVPPAAPNRAVWAWASKAVRVRAAVSESVPARVRARPSDWTASAARASAQA